jgi:hypothetical protein
MERTNGCEEPVSSKSPFTVYHNGVDRASVINLKGENVTEYFNISITDGVVIMNYKKSPSFDEWRKIAGKI